MPWTIGAGLIGLIALVALIWSTGPSAQRHGPTVLAASSLQPALEDIAALWVKQGHEPPVYSFAASSALARQIASGASADLFLSADEDWMDYVQARGKIAPETRANLIGNALVLIAPAGEEKAVELTEHAAFASALGAGRLGVADPDAVPAGKYAKAALHSLGLWEGVADRLAPAENVRAALALVERKQVPLGIVYASDAHDSRAVQVVAAFPQASHPPIRYPIARLQASGARDAEAFRRFLLSERARAVFVRHGFSAL